jgi:DNA-binding CsgD family transcriptional regulator
MKDTAIDARGERMLELLARGSSNRDVARQMGYREGTMRVYLHHLYRKLGVANKTEAVVWYLRRVLPTDAASPEPSGAGSLSSDLFGDMALREDLYAALGVMGAFIGPYGRVWEVGVRLKGDEIDEELHTRRERSRLLWKALLKGDWAYGKRAYDADAGAGLLVDAPSDGVLLASMLLLGGFSSAAGRLVSQLTQKRKGSRGASLHEAAMIRALQAALDEDGEALANLHALTHEKTATPALKQVAMALLFHAYAARKDLERARKTANALWAEAEAARQHLQAMGERPLGTSRSAPAPAKANARRAGIREKAVAR